MNKSCPFCGEQPSSYVGKRSGEELLYCNNKNYKGLSGIECPLSGRSFTVIEWNYRPRELPREYWKEQACKSVKHMLELTGFLRKIITLGLLRASPRLRDEALKILDGFEASDIEDSVTQSGGE